MGNKIRLATYKDITDLRSSINNNSFVPELNFIKMLFAYRSNEVSEYIWIDFVDHGDYSYPLDFSGIEDINGHYETMTTYMNEAGYSQERVYGYLPGGNTNANGTGFNDITGLDIYCDENNLQYTQSDWFFPAYGSYCGKPVIGIILNGDVRSETADVVYVKDDGTLGSAISFSIRNGNLIYVTSYNYTNMYELGM